MPDLSLYLIRHEEAEPGYGIPDEERGLTARGRQRMRSTARTLAAGPDLIDAVFTSPLVRAVQTAEILVQGLGLDEPIAARRVIADPPHLEALVSLVTSVPTTTRGVALVGHEPTLGFLAGHLLGEVWGLRPFKPGAVLALDLPRRGAAGRFLWYLDGETRLVRLP